MTREERLERAARLLDESDGTFEDLACVLARECRYTASECEAFIAAALVDEIEKLLGGAR